MLFSDIYCVYACVGNPHSKDKELYVDREMLARKLESKDVEKAIETHLQSILHKCKCLLRQSNLVVGG